MKGEFGVERWMFGHSSGPGVRAPKEEARSRVGLANWPDKMLIEVQ